MAAAVNVKGFAQISLDRCCITKSDLPPIAGGAALPALQ
jgi:hypothetical protein